MKIAFLVGEFPNLSETFVLNQITGLLSRGQEIDIYAKIPLNTTKIHTDVEKYKLLNYTYYYPQIPSNYLLRLLKGIGLLLTNCLKDPALLLRSLNIFKYGKKAASLRLLYASIPFLGKRPEYDVIQCHFGTNGLKGMDLKEIGAIQGKLCTTFHGLDLSGNLQKYGDRLYDKLFDKGDLFLPISEYWKGLLMELNCDQKKITVHRMGIDCQKFTFTPRQPHPDGQIRLVTVARLVEKKGIEYGIRAVAKLSQLDGNLEYNIVGDGELRESLECLIEELEVGDTISLLGWKERKEIIKILNSAHIFLAPSVTSHDGDREGIPVVLMEAMAMGLPVISTQHSGIPELVEDGVSGFLVPERDWEALANKIDYLIQSPDIWVKMGKEGRLQVEKFYNIDRLNDRLMEIYQQLVGKGINETGVKKLYKY
jgi:colanic acid/amylovoran biosynthesis glycosyltransferase